MLMTVVSCVSVQAESSIIPQASTSGSKASTVTQGETSSSSEQQAEERPQAEQVGGAMSCGTHWEPHSYALSVRFYLDFRNHCEANLFLILPHSSSDTRNTFNVTFQVDISVFIKAPKIIRNIYIFNCSSRLVWVNSENRFWTSVCLSTIFAQRLCLDSVWPLFCMFPLSYKYSVTQTPYNSGHKDAWADISVISSSQNSRNYTNIQYMLKKRRRKVKYFFFTHFTQ